MRRYVCCDLTLFPSPFLTPSSLTLKHPPHSGLGDRFVGVVSSFIMALLSGRAFFMEWPMALHAIQPSTFDWVMPEWYSTEVRTHRGEARLEIVNGACPLHHASPSALDPGMALITVRSNRGCVDAIFDANASDPFFGYRAALEAMGLSQDTAFGCLLASLVAPNDAVINRSRPLLRMLLDPSVLTIGIHIRVGDRAMALDEDVDIDHFGAYWEAAKRIGKQRADYGQSVRWLLVTDNFSLKRKFALRYGTTALLTDVIPFHVSKHDVAKGGVEGQWGNIPHTPQESVVGSFMEWWLLSLCDTIVLNAHSSFSRTAAASALRSRAVYLVGETLPPEGELLPMFGVEAFIGLGNGL